MRIAIILLLSVACGYPRDSAPVSYEPDPSLLYAAEENGTHGYFYRQVGGVWFEELWLDGVMISSQIVDEWEVDNKKVIK